MRSYDLEADFSVVKRRNVFAKSGEEWVLQATLGSDDSNWCLCTWDRKPKQAEYDRAVEVAQRTLTMMHAHQPPYPKLVVHKGEIEE